MPLFGTRPLSDQERAQPPHGVVTHPTHPLPGGTPHDRVQAHHDSIAETREHLDHIAKTLAELNRGPRVLETRTLTIPAAAQEQAGELTPGAVGVWTGDRYRIPFAAVAVENTSTSGVIVTTGPAQSSAPGGGQGQVIVPATSYAAWNMAGSILTIYGTPGAVLTITVFADSVMPFACDLAQTPQLAPAAGLASVTGYGKATGPAGNAVIASIGTAAGQLQAGVQYQLAIQVYLNGTTASPADDDNLKVLVNGVTVGTIPVNGAASANGPGVPPPYSIVTAPITAGGAGVQVEAIAAATGTAIYHVSIVATPLAAS